MTTQRGDFDAPAPSPADAPDPTARRLAWFTDDELVAELRRRNPADAPADAPDELREALRVHHPIMRSETGPFSGCRCGRVRLGQDVIAHVVTELRAALAGTDQQQRGTK